MNRLIAALVFVCAPAIAQVPLGLPQFADPPEANGASYTTYARHILWNSGQLCLQRSTPTAWQCLTTQAQTDAAKADAISQAVSQANASAAATYMPTSTANSAIATMTSSINGNASAITALQNGASALGSRVTSLESTTSTQAGQIAAVTTTANTAATAASVSASVATLNSRIDTVQASIPTVTPDTVCANATVTGLSIPLTGISTTTTITMPGAIAGYPCVVGNPSFLPLGAKGVCIASAANTVLMRFEAGGLLSSILSIPNGTYRACVLIRP